MKAYLSVENFASIFSVEEYGKQESVMKQATRNA
jgi:hypothetical protein